MRFSHRGHRWTQIELRGFDVQQQVAIRVQDEDGYEIGYYEADLVVEKKIIVELKSVRALNDAHLAQLLNYLKATKVRDGLLMNFGSERFEIRKLVF